MKAGDTFLIPLPDTSLDSHCWMAISDPEIDPLRVVLVSFTSWRGDKDQACVVEPSEHPYLSRQSCVNFIDAKVVAAADLDALVASGQIKNNSPLSPTLLEKIRSAVPESRMRIGPAQVMADQGLVDI